MFFPHLSPQLFPLYSKKVLRALSKWDNARTLCLRDISLTTQSVENEFQIFSKTTSGMALPTPNVFETNVFSVLEEAKMMQFTHDCIHIYENELRPSVEEQKTKKELVKDISKIISKIFPETLLEPKIFTFGSYASDLSLTGSSDIDICIAFKGFENIHDNNIHSRILEMIRKEMNPKIIPVEYSHLEPQSKSVGRTRFPILTVHDSKRNLDCDLCVANYLGIVNTRMISTYLMVDQTMLKYYNACIDIHIKNRVKMLIYIVKSWAKRRRISSASEGSLASYSYVLMTLHFLQAIEVLPSLQQLAMSETLSTNICVEDISRPHHVQTYDTKYFNNLEKLPFVWKSSDIEKVSKFTVGHLVFMFFEYYAKHFNFDDHVISIRRGNGSVLRKNVLRNSQTIISIEDPFEHRDLGCVVSNEMGPLIVSEFKRAFEILSNGGSIQEVLLERVGVHSRNIYDEKKDFSGYEDHLPLELVAKMIQKGELFQGELRVNKKKYREAYVTVVGGPFKKDIFIDELKNRNRAMHGDVVAIRVEEKKSVAGSVMKMMKTQDASHEDREQLDYGTSTNVPSEEKKTYQGIVVAILKKKSPSIFPCILMDNTENKDIRWLIPLDRCYPKLRISVSEFNNKFNSKLFLLEEGIFLVKMTPWNKNIKFPRGTLLGCLGFRKDLWSLKRALLLQFFPNMYDHLFSKKEILAEKETGKEASNPKDVLNENDQVETKITDDGFNGDTSDNLIQVEDWSQSRRIFTIDPTHAKDLDDAIAIKPIYESNSEITDWNRKPYEKAQQFLITVAIADVSLYVPLNSPMDKKAKSQGTSIYLMNSVEHMLDPYLSQNLCSLHEGVNRYALAVEFIIDRETCEIMKESVKFNRCIMKSCCRLDYNKTQKMILHYHKNKFKGFVENQMDPIIKFGLETDEVPCVYGNFTLDEIYEDVQIFNELSQKLRRQRAENGNVFLSDMKLNFESDKFGFPVMVSKDEHNESHILIEEMMILANKLVAKALYDYFGESTLLRIHSAPKIDKWSEVVACLAEYIYKWKIENLSNEGEEKRRGEKLIVLSMLEKCLKQNIEGIQENERPITLQQVMNTLIAQTEQHTSLKQVVQYLLLKEMQLAKYATVEDCKNIKPATENDMELQQNPERFQQKYESTWHFALCNEFYTHFTSPIRRYADLIVHRQLIQMMKEKNMLELGQSKEDVLAFRERTFLSSQQISVIAEHLNDQAYKAHYLQGFG
ncbi:hypothetical protein C9374_012743 [Naegleria lovaniensis]|uniref:RNB domain-containing protein n=1 Tax=Naegleria lovaniensis TaxID=51637 RepID=A0AA88H1S9_NAELO|nr:uncharacterized protein C9374_012743 [Naegleria lovaniensis]KAG2392491.1 hypothetical protein C9374_012743 [Naegleria lovaniensis]